MNKIDKPHAIPQFNLYGEINESLHRDAEFIHIEDISTRCKKNNWQINPHRHGVLLQVFCMFEGEIKVKLDERHHLLTGSWVIVIPSGFVHAFEISSETKGVVLTIAEHLLTTNHDQSNKDCFTPLLQSPQLIEFKEEDVLLKQLKNYIKQIEIEFNSAETEQYIMLEWLVKATVLTLKRQLHHFDFQAITNNKSYQIINKFRDLLEKNFTKQWPVEKYASILCISPSTLNRLCKEVVGKSPKTTIQHRLYLEIKRRIIYTDDPLDQIAYNLGFKDPGYFSRFFKKLEGVSPRNYRNNKMDL